LAGFAVDQKKSKVRRSMSSNSGDSVARPGIFGGSIGSAAPEAASTALVS
jgi:hypothetical protein